jgi:fatty acid desaturase
MMTAGDGGHSGAKQQPSLPPRWKIDGQYYDLREFAKAHPGGSYCISLSANHDVTDLFHSYHRPAAIAAVKRFRVACSSSSSSDAGYGDAASPMRRLLHGESPVREKHGAAQHDPRIPRLRALVEARTGRRIRELTTPPLGAATNTCLGLAYALVTYSWFVQPTLCNAISTGVLGWMFAGFIQHEGCHSAFSRRCWANHLARFAIVPWADPRTWFVRHVLEHHPYTNTRADSDFQTDEGVGSLLAHHATVAAGAAARFQLLTQLVGGAFVSFFYSAADAVDVIYTAQPEWQESAAYIVLTCSWFATHYARHGSLFWCVVPHLAFGVCFSNITQWNHIQERATTPVLLDVPRPKSFMAHQASACVDCAYDSVLWSICTIFLNFQTLHHILPGISHHHFLWDQQLRTAIVQFLEEEGILLKMESPGKLVAAHMSWLCEVGGKAATEGVRRCRVDCVGPPLRSN